jgi:hypothetical protein
MPHVEKSVLAFDGHIEPAFAPVREAFVANFEQNLELGAAVAVYFRGKFVVDLVGGLCARGSQTVSGSPISMAKPPSPAMAIT